MIKKKSLILLLLILVTVSAVQSRYQISVPFQVDAGGRPVSSAKVGINISEGATCVTPFYYNITTVAFGRGQINVSSPRLIASRQYTICINATVGSNVVHGRTKFQSPVGDVNVSSLRGWVNGSRSRFDSFFLNNGSTFDVLYGRTNQTLATAVLRNNTNRGKIYFNNSLFSARNLSFMGLQSGSILRALYIQSTLSLHIRNSTGQSVLSIFEKGNITSYVNLTFAGSGVSSHAINNLSFIRLGRKTPRHQLNVTNGTGTPIFGTSNVGNFTVKSFNGTSYVQCGLMAMGNGSVRMYCNGQRILGGG